MPVLDDLDNLHNHIDNVRVRRYTHISCSNMLVFCRTESMQGLSLLDTIVRNRGYWLSISSESNCCRQEPSGFLWSSMVSSRMLASSEKVDSNIADCRSTFWGFQRDFGFRNVILSTKVTWRGSSIPSSVKTARRPAKIF